MSRAKNVTIILLVITVALILHARVRAQGTDGAAAGVFEQGLKCFGEKDYYCAAEKLAEAVPETSGSAQAYKLLGQALFRIGKYKGAFESLEKSVLLDGTDPEVHFTLGLACRNLSKWQSDNTGHCFAYYIDAIILDRSYIDKYFSVLHNEIGVEIDRKKILTRMEGLSSIKEPTPEDLNAMGTNFISLGDCEKAIDALSGSVEMKRETSTLLMRGRAFICAGRFEEAVADITEGISSVRDPYSFYYYRWTANAGAGQCEAAIRDYSEISDKSKSKENVKWDAYFNFALCNYRINKPVKAAGYLNMIGKSKKKDELFDTTLIKLAAAIKKEAGADLKNADAEVSVEIFNLLNAPKEAGVQAELDKCLFFDDCLAIYRKLMSEGKTARAKNALNTAARIAGTDSEKRIVRALFDEVSPEGEKTTGGGADAGTEVKSGSGGEKESVSRLAAKDEKEESSGAEIDQFQKNQQEESSGSAADDVQTENGSVDIGPLLDASEDCLKKYDADCALENLNKAVNEAGCDTKNVKEASEMNVVCPRVLKKRGKVYLENGKNHSAELDLKAALNLNPINVETMFILGMKYIKENNPLFSGIYLLRTALLDPDYIENMFSELIYWHDMQPTLNNKKQIKDHLDNIMKDNNGKIPEYKNVEVEYLLLGEYKKAIDRYSKRISMLSKDYDFYRGVYSNSSGLTNVEMEQATGLKTSDEIEFIEMKQYPITNVLSESYYGRGVTYARLGMYGKAGDDFSKALKIEKNELYYLYRGYTVAATGKCEGAMRDFENYRGIRKAGSTLPPSWYLDLLVVVCYYGNGDRENTAKYFDSAFEGSSKLDLLRATMDKVLERMPR